MRRYVHVQRLGRVLKCILLAVGLLSLAAAEAPAAILTFIHTGNGSGTLDGDPFPPSDFVITAQADTSDRLFFSDGWWIDHLSATISIEGLGELDFLSPTRHFVNNTSITVGFSRGVEIGGLDLLNGPADAAFNTWDMTDPIGPISGLGFLVQWSSDPQMNTSGGILIFNHSSSDSTFTAIPEPTTLIILLPLLFIHVRRR